MSIEDYRNSIPPELVFPLRPDDKKPAKYVLARSSSTWRSSSADGITAGGVIRITISNDSMWLCPETVRLMFTVNNLAPASSDLEGTWDGGEGTPATVFNDLQPTGGGACFISRLRVLCGGQLIEDISDYGRLCELFGSLNSDDKVLNNEISDFSSVPLSGSYANNNFKKI